MENYDNEMMNFNILGIHPDTEAILKHYKFERLPVEGTLFISTYRSPVKTSEGTHAGTAMIGLYSENPLSVSCFHKLTIDEVWHAYSGDPFILVLLHPDGSSEEVLMGCDPLNGQKVQFVIPANTWQAGYIAPGGRYALFGCTMAPGFNPGCFEAGTAGDLIKKYPDRAKDIIRLSVNGNETRMPEGFDK